MTHNLKIRPDYFDSVLRGTKTFEVRKNDRNYNVGDILVLQEYSNHGYSGRQVTVEAVYILNDRNYCKDDYIIIGIRKYERNY